MEATYKRRILVRRGTDRIDVDLEDNFHRFGVYMVLDGGAVAEVGGRADRVPWITCPAALAALQDLQGHDVRRPLAIDRGAKAARHCTHLFDLARLALDHLRLDIPGRDYVVCVAGPMGRERISLSIDGRAARAEAGADDDPLAFLEQMLVRRAVHISRGRFIDQDRWATAADVGAAPTCISFQPGVRESATRVAGSSRDFTGRADRLLADLFPEPGRTGR